MTRDRPGLVDRPILAEQLMVVANRPGDAVPACAGASLDVCPAPSRGRDRQLLVWTQVERLQALFR
ncbi:hypothetical protein [Rubidibacter lacunae]|uniref:hypothetical protein n=1 Tax=Rubidibacter lacunae TaxID=582514 RepID=UPI00058B8424|nr:hypothetical protein [Rubidibacter lacunae]